ncbi:MAG: hypothetical protein AAF557_10030 [Pseudomonadota bacterium]
MTNCPDDLELEAFIDQQDGANHAKIACHLEGCASCRDRVRDLRALNDLVRQVERQTVAPRSFVDRLRQESVARNARRPVVNRRLVLGAGLATAACLGGVVAIQQFRQGGQHDLQATLFGDFHTLVAADRQLDFQSADMAEVIAWFAPRVPFELPKLSMLEPLKTRGGRLCWLAERRFAAVDFDTADGTVCLYICRSEDLRVNPDTPIPQEDDDLIVATEAGISGAFWQQNDVMLSLIGNPNATGITAIADQVRHGIRQRTAS